MTMRCTECLFQIAGNKAADLRHCITCGRQLVPSVRDVLEHNCYGIVDELRPEQVRMAVDIDNLINSDAGKTLLAEGGTGLGKSYAYTIPALLKHIEITNSAPPNNDVNAFRIVIATAKKPLQAQLSFHLPKICVALGVPTSTNIVVYKGLNNYACWKLGAAIPTEPDRKRFAAFLEAPMRNNHPADVTDWPGPKPEWWDDINLENCPLGVGCEYYRTCRPSVKDANIIITNQHLLGLDLTLFQPGWLLGPYQLLVVDEAHHFHKAMRSLLTKELHPKSLKRAATRLMGDPRMHDVVREIGGGKLSATVLGERIEAAQGSIEQLLAIVAAKTDTSKRYQAAAFQQNFENCKTVVATALVSLIPIHDELVRNYDITRHTGGEKDDHDVGYFLNMLSRFNRIIKPVTNAKAFIEKHLDAATIQQYITVATNNTDEQSLHMTPLEVGPIMGPLLQQVPKKVFVSATISLEGNFTNFKDDLGLVTADEKVYQSAFDVTKKVVLYLPPFDMPLPAHQLSPERTAWLSSISKEIRQLCRAAKGGTFVLFTSERDMLDVVANIGTEMQEDDGLHLIVQPKNTPVDAYVDEFRQYTNSVLFGLKSIWEGIDIVGDQLRCVIVPKLPFPNPGDPVYASRSEIAEAKGEKSFFTIAIPAMFTEMRQGTGRLIRSAKDKGVIAILDIRIWTGGGQYHADNLEKAKKTFKRFGYGKKLLDVLGFTTWTNDFTRLEEWFKKTFRSLNTVNTVKEGESQNGTTERF